MKQVHNMDIVSFVSAIFAQDVVHATLQVNSIIHSHYAYFIL